MTTTNSYLTKPVGVGDGDVVGAVVPVTPTVVGNGGQVWKVPVEVDVLSVSSTGYVSLIPAILCS